MHLRSLLVLPFSDEDVRAIEARGSDAKTSVLDLNCKAHDLDNLYVVDGSSFPSSAAVSPALTIIANALRVGEHIAQRLK